MVESAFVRAVCRLLGFDPAAVRGIEMTPGFVAVEVYVLDGQGCKQVDGDEPVTEIKTLEVAR